MPDQPEVKGQTAEPVLRLLSELGATVDHTETDVRGLRVEDENGEAVGTVTDLVVDDVEKSGHFLVAERGGFIGLGTRHTDIPVQAVARDTENAVRLPHPRSHIMSAPAYAPDLVDDRTYRQSIYHHYGYPPFADTDYGCPVVPYVR